MNTNHFTSPEEFFGFKPGADGELCRWDKVVEYFHLLEIQSDRVTITNMGPTTLGNPFLKVVITSPENHKNLEEYRKISLNLADPRGMSDDEIDLLVKKGKAVCVQSMTLHSEEEGGIHMAVNLAYDLATQSTDEIKNILENVIFVMVPCFNPDGQIMMTDWYYNTKGTANECTYLPSLYHHYAGHDNNRDGFHQYLVESQYMGKILFHQWMPQAYQDHHHMGYHGARIQIAPCKNPLRPHVDPIIWRELNWYGANMAYQMEEKGLDGVSSGGQFPSWGHFSFNYITNCHNIAGMLTESAGVKVADPVYVDPTQLKGDGDLVMPEYEATTTFPNPWPGGWWHLSDVVDRMYTAAYALLDTMARNKDAVLKNMAQKALNQTKRGFESSQYAYIIPEFQHDVSEVYNLIRLLLQQNIEVSRAKEPFPVGYTTYPTGTFVVFMAQPKMALVPNLLGKTKFPTNHWASDGITPMDVTTDTYNEYMNVEAIEAGCKFDGNFDIVKEAPAISCTTVKSTRCALIGSDNSSYKTVNLALKEGLRVCRINSTPNHDFYLEGDSRKISSVLAQAPTQCSEVEEELPAMSKVKALKVGLYQHYNGGNTDEGWTRLLLESYGFEYTTVFNEDIHNGLEGFDVLILPSDPEAMLIGPKHFPDDPEINFMMLWAGPMHEDYREGMGLEGAKKVREFVERGGRLLAFNRSSDFAIKHVGLCVRNVVAGVPRKAFSTHGSTVAAAADNTQQVCYGMPANTYLLHWDGPCFEIGEMRNADKYKIAMHYANENVLRSGRLIGEEHIAGKGAVVTCSKGAGEVVLYGFSPQKRNQTTGTFKLVFNMLYR